MMDGSAFGQKTRFSQSYPAQISKAKRVIQGFDGAIFSLEWKDTLWDQSEE